MLILDWGGTVSMVRREDYTSVVREGGVDLLNSLVDRKIPFAVITGGLIDAPAIDFRNTCADAHEATRRSLRRRTFSALKERIDESWCEVESELDLPGEDPVRLRRKAYFEAIEGAFFYANRRAVTVEDFSKTLVVGDSFRTDLALPLAMGCHVGLINSTGMPMSTANEWRFVRSHPRGHGLSGLNDVLDIYDGLQAQ